MKVREFTRLQRAWRRFLAFFGLAVLKDVTLLERKVEVAEEMRIEAMKYAKEAQPKHEAADALNASTRAMSQAIDQFVLDVKNTNNRLRHLLSASLRRSDYTELERKRIEVEIEKALKEPIPTFTIKAAEDASREVASGNAERASA